jgi:tetratricopeptide (TPR) repeat protein
MTIVLVYASGISTARATDYDDLIQKGKAEMEGAAAQEGAIATREKMQIVINQYQEAANIFREAEQKDPINPLAWFWRGVVYNRIGQVIENFNKDKCKDERGAPVAFCTALDQIYRAKSLGMNSHQQPTFPIQLAFALFKTGQLLEAKRTIDQFLSAGSNTDAAQKLRPDAENLRNEIERNINAAKNAKKKIHICGDAPKSFVTSVTPPASNVKDLLKTGEKVTQPSCPIGTIQSQYLKSITTGFGYNGNVIPLGNGLSLPPGFPHKDAFFEESTLNLEADWYFYHPVGSHGLVDKLAATYLGIHDAYIDLSKANTLIQTGGLSYCHCFSEKTCGGFQVGDAWLRSDTKNLSNILSLQPNVSYAESPELTTKLSYSAIRYDYSITPKQFLAVQDGFGQQLAIEQTWAHSISDGVWSPDVTITAKYLHQWFVTEGIVGDKQRNDSFVKVDWCIFKADGVCAMLRSVNLLALYEYRHDGYENVTFPALKDGTTFKRQDDTHIVDVRITFKLLYDEQVTNRLEAVLDYQSNINDSNIATDEYDQPRFMASLKVNF